MWCVADLDAEYLRKMEDVLAVYEKPYRAAEPVVCLDEKPVSLHADLRAPLPARPGQVAKRDNEIQTLWNRERLLCRGTQGGQAFYLPDPGSLSARVGSRPESNHRQLSVCSNHPSGHGQSQHPLPEDPYRLLWGGGGRVS